MSLKIQALAVRRGGRTIIAGLDAVPFEPGSLTAVLGPNGAGKSTLIQALAGLLASKGSVELDGQNLNTLAPLHRSHKVGLLPQSLPEATGLVAYELLLGGVLASGASRAEAEQRIEEVLDRLDLRALAMARLDTLSGGQRQMMALAQVLARRPRLMLLDEPTSALDLYWQLAVLEAVREDARRRGSMVLMALHDLDLALRHCDRVLVLASGAKLVDGAPREVLTPDLLARVYGIDARVETCSHGRPRLLVDGLLNPLQAKRPAPQHFNPA
ncbi:MAG: ABC transporter ATP-binding protein [Roseateles asaccharophilus]|jgi:iron complex transport system ATP-binding protein|uniref:Iron complex transport system ATP-binding protein n=1 Tax=Roseateles asaccharophilus TaxID=582607 RepID=A0A4R6MRI6_9BURK|nr:ABC transporter ATP-binding protein [Roseateles asaccharophilus]MDN3546422.1 ABC transporter ATP-binding protein [Roseateles asaccharophilus]TDP04547.1 iron complex transport system ATP-binding protein [Roseateles asaccharophilus]